MINIASPCPQKWENMMPAIGGNYCDQCCKVVVDFSDCSNEEIANYFTTNTGKKVCGRFKTEQVNSPKRKNNLSRFLAALIVAFGTFIFASCHNKEPEYLVGDVAYTPDSTQLSNMKADSAKMADSVAKLNQPK